jgi:hypothetical protein
VAVLSPPLWTPKRMDDVTALPAPGAQQASNKHWLTGVLW